MTNYKQIKDVCQQSSSISRRTIDDFLIYYAEKQDKAGGEADREFAKYRHITRQFDPGWKGLFKSQYIGHRIFKQNGLIHKYLTHSAVKGLDPEERTYLAKQAATPWRFSFSTIAENPEEDFYIMNDIFTHDSFLLYSPAVNKVKKEGSMLIWFNLIGFNGACWQSFGPIGSYMGFDPDDIYFFSTELNDDIESDEDVVNHIQKNPVPYMMLISGGRIPLIYHKEEQIISNISEDEGVAPVIAVMKKDFKIDSAGQVIQFGLKGWNEFPHFSQLYYDKKKGIFLRSSMTDRGFTVLTEKLNSFGYDFSKTSDVRVSLAMLTTAKKILKKKIELNEYEKLFTKDPDPDQQRPIDEMNYLIQLMLPDMNAGKDPDIQALVLKTGSDPETVKAIAAHLQKTMKRIRP